MKTRDVHQTDFIVMNCMCPAVSTKPDSVSLVLFTSRIAKHTLFLVSVVVHLFSCETVLNVQHICTVHISLQGEYHVWRRNEKRYHLRVSLID